MKWPDDYIRVLSAARDRSNGARFSSTGGASMKYEDMPVMTYTEARDTLATVTEPRTLEQVREDIEACIDPVDQEENLAAVVEMVWGWIEHERRGNATLEATNDQLSSQVLDLQHRFDEYREAAQTYIRELEGKITDLGSNLRVDGPRPGGGQ